MAKRRAVVPTKSAPPAPIITPTNPDASRQERFYIPLEIDPVEQFRKQTDLFVQREILWNLYRHCPSMRTIAHSIASDISSQEVVVTPIQKNPAASTILQAKRAIDLVNNAMNRPGGVIDFVINLVDGYWGSKTGTFILTPRDMHGNILSIGVLPPNLPRPYYGYDNDAPVFFMNNQRPILAIGIWFVEPSIMGGNYFVLPADHYFQVCYGSVGYGAFQDGEPIAEQQISAIVTDIVLSDYYRKSLMATDDAQILLLENVDTKEFKAKSDQNKEVQARRRQGLPVNPEDEGNRLVVTSRDLDKPAKISTVNLRTFPEGFNPEEELTRLDQRLALAVGVHPRRAAADIQKERFGNAAQASMLNTDEPGLREIKTLIKTFMSSVLLSGLPLRAEFVPRGTPENYWMVDRDVKLAQVVSQVKDVLPNEILQKYLVDQGMIDPGDIGMESIRSEDGTPVSTGWVTLRDRIGHLLTYEAVSTYPLLVPFPPFIGTKAADPEFVPCADAAVARWNEWIRDDLPSTVTRQNGVPAISYYGLKQEVDDITVEVYHDLIQCAKKHGGRSSDPRVRNILDAFKAFFYNVMGSPAIRQYSENNPHNNLFDALWGLAGRIAAGTATIATMQAEATRFTKAIRRYANSTRAATYMVDGLKSTGAVDWVLGETEHHCNMCPAFARHYDSFDELITHTGGLLPGDVRLTCSGNCLCHLEFA